MRELGDNKPQSVGPGESTVDKGAISVLQDRISGARWAAGQTSPQFRRAEPPAADAKEDQRSRNSTLVCGARLSQQWSGACPSYTLRVVYPTLWVSW